MNRHTLPITDVLVEDRQRIDYGDLDTLAASLTTYGLIQPIIVNQEKRLIAGGRRLKAAQSLGWTMIDVAYKETLSVDELHELELEENVRRKNMAWQEECLTIAKIHSIKVRDRALNGESWGQRETAELFGGINVATVNYTLRVAKLLKEELLLPEKQRRGWQAESIADCWKNVIMRDELEKANARLAQLAKEAADASAAQAKLAVEQFTQELTFAPVQESFTADEKTHILALRERARVCYLDLNEQEAETLYKSNPLNPVDKFKEYYEEKRQWWTSHLTLDITKNFLHTDSIAFMNLDENEGVFDHVITDIPYGIDMDMLNQENNAVKDIDSVLNEHGVEGNMSLMEKFFPAAFKCTKDTAFLVTWMDQMQWAFMYDLAIKAGFRVQRWPLTWCKTHSCMNQSAQFNFTKSTEIAMVCRKPGATLTGQQPVCHVEASNVDARKEFDHPFAKPFAIWKFILDAVSIEGQTILEPFAGRGSGVIAMLKTKRKVIGVEINQAHYNALIENVKRHYLAMNPRLILK